MINHPDVLQNYLKQVAPPLQQPVIALFETVAQHLPRGFEQVIQYGMITWVVPLSLYPAGYHTSKGIPLPFLSIAMQKNHLAFYHMGIYHNQELREWFVAEYRNQTRREPDMGKSCLRLKPNGPLPVHLLGALCKKITPEQYVTQYQNQIAHKTKLKKK